MEQHVAPGAAGTAGEPGASPAPADEPDAATLILQGVGTDPAPTRTRRVLLGIGAGVVVLLGLYAGAQWYVADKVPHGTTVAGVAIGGQSVAAAERTLTDALADRVTEPVAVVAGSKKATLDPQKAGLSVDVPATVEPLASFSLAPQRLWSALFGGDEVAPVVDAAGDELDARLAAIAKSVDVAPVDGAVRFVDGSVTSTAPKDGTSLDTEAAYQVVVDAWLRSDDPVELPVETVHPAVGGDAVEDALVAAGHLTSSPVQVTVGSRTVKLPADALAAVATFAADGSKLTLHLDPAGLRKAVLARGTGLVTAAKDASFVFEDGKPVVKDGKNGTDLDADTLAQAVTGVATKTSGRAVTVEPVVKEPAVTKAHLESLGVTKQVAEFSTPLTNEPLRTDNLRIGARKVTGDLVEPGATFSMLDALAPITTAGGYHSAHIIENGQLVDGVGGGLSQMATTTYNAAYFAGLDIVTHKPHSYYIPRYPEGREATLYVPTIDMKFTNDTPYGVLLRAWIAGDRLHVAVWSTPYYTVESTTSARSDVVPVKTVHDASSSCVASSGGEPGFTVRVRRVVKTPDGAVAKDETNRWTYNPQNVVICTKGGK